MQGWLAWPQVPAAVVERGRGLGGRASAPAEEGRPALQAVGGGRGRPTRLPFLKVGCRSSICARVVDFHWSELIWSKMIAGQPRPIPMFGTEPFDGCTSGNILMGSKSLTSLDSGLEVQRRWNRRLRRRLARRHPRRWLAAQWPGLCQVRPEQRAQLRGRLTVPALRWPRCAVSAQLRRDRRVPIEVLLAGACQPRAPRTNISHGLDREGVC